MLTQEQIRNLKKGVELALSFPLHFVEYDDENDELMAKNNGEVIYFKACEVELPRANTNSQSQFSNTRLFKKGDKVRVVAWNGRDIARLGQIGQVVSDEHSSNVELAIDDWSSCVYYPACHLELVTPVEELEPYTVDECGFAPTFYVRKNGKAYMTIPYKEGSSLFQSREEALAAAEAECKRLNAEWRKEMGNEN